MEMPMKIFRVNQTDPYVDLWKICGFDECDLISELGAPVKDIAFKSSKWLILFNFPCRECKVIVV